MSRESPKPLLLEAFSGTGSVGRAFREHGWDVYSIDVDPRARADFQGDILGFDAVRELQGRRVDAMWASPPCTFFSRARAPCGATSEEMEHSDGLVRKTLEIWETLGCPPVFIENPHSGSLKNRGLLDQLSMRVVDYCRYADWGYRKRTSIWTNTEWTPARPLCRHDCPSSIYHGPRWRHKASAQRGGPGPIFSQRELYRIPPELCEEIAGFATSLVR